MANDTNERDSMSPTDNAPSSAPKVKFSLTLKLFLLVLLSFGVLMTFIVKQVAIEANKVANETIGKSLKQADTILNTRLESRFTSIYETAGNLARDGRLLPLIYAQESASLQDQCSEFEQSLNFDILIFTNDEGEILARSDDPGAIGAYVGESTLFTAALDGDKAMGIMRSNNQLLQIVAIPVLDNAASDIIRGTVALAYNLSKDLADEIKNLAGSEIAFYAFPPSKDSGSSGSPAEVYNTFENNRSALQEYLEKDSALWNKIYKENKVQEVELMLSNEIFHALIRPLQTSDNMVIGFTIALRSRTELLRPFTIIQKRVTLISVICMIVACILSYAIARHIVKPIIGLVSVTEMIQEGDYPEEIEIKRSDEVGVLYSAVYKMGQELKEKAELEEYLAGISDDFSGVDADSATLLTEDMSTVHPVSEIPAAVKDQFQPGKIINNRYKIDATIGAGAMGIVYLAHDQELNEPVALKMIITPGLTDKALEQFKVEIRLARKITHKNVLRTHDFGTFDNLPYISMEHVQGYDLSQLIRKKGALEIKMGIMLARQICSAIGAAHDEGIIHRDLKPQNIMINRQGVLKIMDFGIAVSVNQDEISEEKSDSGFDKKAMVGTPNFMSPEQFMNIEVDLRTDLYSLGVILFFMFSGELPFEDKSLWGLAKKHKTEAPPKLSLKNSKVPKELEEIVEKALAKERQDRFSNAREIGLALTRIKVT